MKGKTGKMADWVMTESIRQFRDLTYELLKLAEPADRVGQKNVPGKDGEEDFMLDNLIRDVCRSCPRYRTCFGERKEETQGELVRIFHMSDPDQSEENEQVSLAFRKTCIYYSSLVEEAAWLMQLLHQNRYWKNRLFRMKGAVLDQLALQHRILDECVRQAEYIGSMDPVRLRKLRWNLFKKGILLRDGGELAVTDGDFDLILETRVLRAWRKAPLEKYISSVCQKQMVLKSYEEWIPAGRRRLHFIPENQFHITFGQAHESRPGEAVCGDTFSFIAPDRKRAVLCLADGMGTGVPAYESSSHLIEALESMLLSGMSEETALGLLDAVLAVKEDQNSSTLDLTAVSLQSGLVRILKAGGCVTFIRRKDRVERIVCDSIPLGFIRSGAYRTSLRKLYDGDMIVMVSDGMLTFEQRAGETVTMESILSEIKTIHAQTFAEEIMHRIPRSPGEPEDDRTVLVAAVWEKHFRRR